MNIPLARTISVVPAVIRRYSLHSLSLFIHFLICFESVDTILWCDHLNETSLVILVDGGICFSISIFHLFFQYTKWIDRYPRTLIGHQATVKTSAYDSCLHSFLVLAKLLMLS